MKLKLIVPLLSVFVLAACGEKIGSDAWCSKMEEKDKGDWTIEQAGDYTKYCVLGMDPAKWCEKMERKNKGDWTASEAADYAKNCIGRD